MGVEEQVAQLWAAQNGFLDEVPLDQVGAARDRMLDQLRARRGPLLRQLAREQRLTPEATAELATALGEFRAGG